MVLARRPATRGCRVQWDAEAGDPLSTSGKSVVWGENQRLMVPKDGQGKQVIIGSRQTEVRRSLMAVKPMTQLGQWAWFGPDRAFVSNINIGRVMPYESTPNGWNLTVELEGPMSPKGSCKTIMNNVWNTSRTLTMLVEYLTRSNRC